MSWLSNKALAPDNGHPYVPHDGCCGFLYGGGGEKERSERENRRTGAMGDVLGLTVLILVSVNKVIDMNRIVRPSSNLAVATNRVYSQRPGYDENLGHT